MQDQNLSTNFTLSELTYSPSGVAAGIDNTPPMEAIENLRLLAKHILQPLRNHFKKPVRVTSGYRCPALNKLLGGAKDSQHVLGQAADIKIDGVANVDIFNFIRGNLPHDQVIAEKLKRDDGNAGWVHVSYSPRHRRQELSYLGKLRGYVKGLHFI